MDFYHFTEFAWPHLPPDDEFTSARLNLPSSVYDPKKGADLYNMCLDQYVLADGSASTAWSTNIIRRRPV